MKFSTRFKIGDVADFQHNGKWFRIRVDEIRIQTLNHIGENSKILIEYRQRNANSKSIWLPEAWAI